MRDSFIKKRLKKVEMYFPSHKGGWKAGPRADVAAAQAQGPDPDLLFSHPKCISQVQNGC